MVLFELIYSFYSQYGERGRRERLGSLTNSKTAFRRQVYEIAQLPPERKGQKGQTQVEDHHQTRQLDDS